MKRILFLLACTSFQFAQSQSATLSSASSVFVLTPSGFRNASDTSKDYLIFSVPEHKKSDLFKSVLMFAQKRYVNPKNVISQVPDESITLNGFAPGSIGRNSMFFYDMDYTVNIEFKDDKIKVQAPTFTLSSTAPGSLVTLKLVSNNSLDGSYQGIWNLRGKLKAERAKRNLETFFDLFLVQMRQAIESKNDW